MNAARRNLPARGEPADVAQMAEQLTCNQQVAGSIPAVGSRAIAAESAGLESDRRTAACGSSSVGRASAFQAERRGFDSRLPLFANCETVQAWSERAEFTSARDCHRRSAARAASEHRTGLATDERAGGQMARDPRARSAQVAQSAEHVLGKDEVGGSIPLLGLLNSAARRHVQRSCAARVGEERYPSGQREQTVNLPAYAFGGSNPPLSMTEEENDGYRLPATVRGAIEGAGRS